MMHEKDGIFILLMAQLIVPLMMIVIIVIIRKKPRNSRCIPREYNSRPGDKPVTKLL